MLADRTREPLSTTFLYHDNNIAMISYVPKKNRSVILLSSMHYSNSVHGIKNKPEAIHFYNRNKAGVDVMDQMLGTYSCKRKTNRWPVAFFYNMLDISAMASYVIYNYLRPNDKTDARRKFLHLLCEQLVTPQAEKRSSIPRVAAQFATKHAIQGFFRYPIMVGSVNKYKNDVHTFILVILVCRNQQ